MNAFPEKIEYAKSIWDAEDKRITSETKAMEALRKAMHGEGTPIPANPQDDKLIADKYKNDMRLKNSVMRIMMGG